MSYPLRLTTDSSQSDYSGVRAVTGSGGVVSVPPERAASRRASSRQSEIARAIAPQLTAISATLKVGQRHWFTPRSRKSTTP